MCDLVKSENERRTPERSINFLFDKKLSDSEILIYEGLLGIKINQEDIIYLRVWEGCGTVNCHTIPILKTSEVNETVTRVKEISERIIKELEKEKNCRIGFIETDWRTDIQSHELNEYMPQFMKIFTLVGFGLVYKNDIQELNFHLGKILDKIHVINNNYMEIEGKNYYK